MVTVIRTAEISQHLFMEAVQWAAKVTAHIHTKHQGNTQLNKNVGGDVAEIHWISTFADLGQFETFRNALEADPEYQNLFHEATSEEYFVPGSSYDQIFTSMTIPS